MNRLFLMMILLLFIVPQAWASDDQYPSPYRQTMWNSMTDGLHTLGQNPHQASLTLRKLHRARTNARLRSINRARNHALLQNHDQ